MEKWDWQRMDYNPHEGKHPSVGHYRRHHHHHHHRSRNPSFSSALLDAICKSTEDEQRVIAETRSPEKKNTSMLRNSSCKRAARSERETQGRERNEDHWMSDGRRRSAEISVFDAEKCFETHAIESLGGLNATAAAAEEDSEAEGAAYHKQRAFQLLCQSISSAASCSSETSDNTSNWPYSSSDAESLYRPTGKCSAKSARNFVGREEKARKWASCMARGRERSQDCQGRSSVKDGHFRSTSGEPFVPEEHAKSKPSKSKFRKDSKKPKQPISPGSRLASFLNSLFMAGGAKKAKLSSSPSVSESNSYYSSQRKPAASSACSSSSSVHRSCLSKTSSSRGKTGNGVRRSVTFYPPSIVVDECSRPCGHMENRTAHANPANPYVSQSADGYKLPWLGEKLQLQLLEKGNQASTAEEIIAKYHKANSLLEAVARELEEDQDEDDDDDAASCSSSDLFELENLAPSDISLYQKELPVYETTHLATNKAIAKGLIV